MTSELWNDPVPVETALAGLRQQFADQLPVRIEAIRASFMRLDPAAWQLAEAQALHRLVHSLTGAAGTFGMHSLSVVAHELEQHLAAMLQDEQGPSMVRWREAIHVLERLEKLAQARLQQNAPSLKQPHYSVAQGSPLIDVVEDDAEQARQLSVALEQDGYRVRVFTELAEFRAAWSSGERPAAVVLDLIFPQGDTAGALLMGELKAGQEWCPPIVVVSVRDDLDARLAAFRSGASRYLTKPVNPLHLARLLDSLTGRLPAQPFRVLMVDDDPLPLEANAAVLRHAGMEVRTVTDPRQALDALHGFAPDVLVLDIYMPDVSGPELAAVLREQEHLATLPILFLSAETNIDKQLLALDLGGDDFLVKPVQPAHLVAMVTARARRWRQNNETMAHLHQALYEREREHLALDHHAIVSIANRAGNITYVNDKFCAISGYRRDELLGQNHRILKSGQHPPEFYQDLWRTIAGGNVWQGAVCNRNKDGSLYWVESTITPFLDDKGKPYQYVSIRTDISHMKATEMALLEASRAADRANQTKSEFLSSMSHELRTPMNAILGFAQLMECDDNLGADQQDNVHEILKAGRHLLTLINEVLDLAKVESGHLELSLEPVAVAALVEECLSLVQPLADARGIRINQLGLERVVVRADHTRLKQVLLNLLSNAIKYNRAGGSIHLQAQPAADECLRILVTDTGQGIPAEKLAEIFQPFNRLGAEHTAVEGTGIGLTISQRIVEIMGGTLGVESEIGVGSTFWIDLPNEFVPQEGAIRVTATAPLIPAAGPEEWQRTVLFIEDNPANLKLVAQLLGHRQHIHLLTAHTPELGIELAQAYHPALILLDINLPGMDGYQVMEVLKSDACLNTIPVVAITANAMPRDIARGMAAGFKDYLTKPLDITQFYATLDRLLSIDTILPPGEAP